MVDVGLKRATESGRGERLRRRRPVNVERGLYSCAEVERVERVWEGCWGEELAAGCWLLAAGCWLLAGWLASSGDRPVDNGTTDVQLGETTLRIIVAVRRPQADIGRMRRKQVQRLDTMHPILPAFIWIPRSPRHPPCLHAKYLQRPGVACLGGGLSNAQRSDPGNYEACSSQPSAANPISALCCLAFRNGCGLASRRT